MSCSTLLISLLVLWNFIIFNANCETIICGLSETECNCNAVMDSPEPCSLHCTTTDVCKDTLLNCRIGDPCSILCQGYSSCGDATIQPNSATDVSITCDGTDACTDLTATCGSGDCTMQCDDSCMEIISINTSLATSFACNGNCVSDVIPESSPTIQVTPSPIIQRTLSPSIAPTSSPTTNPPTKSFGVTVRAVNPTHSPSTEPTKSRNIDQEVATSASHLSTQKLLEEDVIEIRYIETHPQFTSFCYIVIAVASTIVICVCLLACVLVYVQNKHTQQLLRVTTQTYKANLTCTQMIQENTPRSPPPPQQSLVHIQTPSFMMNPPAMHPYQIPPLMNTIPYTPHMTPNLTALHRTVSAISVNNDARSHVSHGEGTETNRKISDLPALPHAFGYTGDTAAHVYDTGYIKHVRQRASIHMTPAGYMDDEFITVKRKKTGDNHDLTPGAQSPALTNNSNAHSNIHSPVNIEDTNHVSLEVLRLGEDATQDERIGVHIATYHDEHHDTDVDEIQIDPSDIDDSKRPEPETQTYETMSNTEDLSRELFTTRSDSHSRNVSHDVLPVTRSAWYQYHQVGSLPVIISCNNATHAKQPPIERSQSVVLTIKHTKEDPEEDTVHIDKEPLQLPGLLNNNLIPPTDDTESTYNSDSYQGEVEQEEYRDEMETDGDYSLSPLEEDGEEYPSRITKSTCIDSDTHSRNVSHDAYFEMKPLVESSNIVTTECEASEVSEVTEVDSMSLLSSCTFREEEMTETSVEKEHSVNGDSIIMQHADKLVHLLSQESTYNGQKSSISFGF